MPVGAVHIEERLSFATECIPFLGNSLCGEVNLIDALPIGIVYDPVVVRLQFGAVLEEEVLRGTGGDLNVFRYMRIESCD